MSKKEQVIRWLEYAERDILFARLSTEQEDYLGAASFAECAEKVLHSAKTVLDEEAKREVAPAGGRACV